MNALRLSLYLVPSLKIWPTSMAGRISRGTPVTGQGSPAPTVRKSSQQVTLISCSTQPFWTCQSFSLALVVSSLPFLGQVVCDNLQLIDSDAPQAARIGFERFPYFFRFGGVEFGGAEHSGQLSLVEPVGTGQQQQHQAGGYPVEQQFDLLPGRDVPWGYRQLLDGPDAWSRKSFDVRYRGGVDGGVRRFQGADGFVHVGGVTLVHIINDVVFGDFDEVYLAFSGHLEGFVPLEDVHLLAGGIDDSDFPGTDPLIDADTWTPKATVAGKVRTTQETPGNTISLGNTSGVARVRDD